MKSWRWAQNEQRKIKNKKKKKKAPKDDTKPATEGEKKEGDKPAEPKPMDTGKWMEWNGIDLIYFWFINTTLEQTRLDWFLDCRGVGYSM